MLEDMLGRTSVFSCAHTIKFAHIGPIAVWFAFVLGVLLHACEV